MRPHWMLGLLLTATPAAAERWTYDAAAEIRPVELTLPLEATPPDDLAQEADYRGTKQLFGQLRYGSENSRRVTIVVDQLEAGEVDFYVDADRDRVITNADRLAGDGRTRECDVPTEIIQEDRPLQAPRRLRLRLGITRNRIGVATLGWVVGDVRSPAGGHWQVRRVDGNANGLFSDARDRLLIDVDGDHRFDPLDEQSANQPVLAVADHRFAVRSDRLGRRFDLERLEGVGRLQVAVESLPEGARITAFEAMVFSDDGSAYAFRDAGRPQVVPVGRYTLGSVTLTIDTGEREPWHFVFSRQSIPPSAWRQVAADEEVSLQAVGRPRFSLQVRSDVIRPGDYLSITPRLHTEDGLLINLSCRARQIGSFASERSHNRCQMKLIDGAGQSLVSARSGFA